VAAVGWGADRLSGRPDHRARDPETAHEEADVAETYSGEFYCVKCKEKREATGDVVVNDKGTRMAKATCPVCGTNLNRILGRA
jgi:transcription elongation factor Elf1